MSNLSPKDFMIPRRATSKKWTSFPTEFLETVGATFKETFAGPLADSTLIVEGRIFPEELVLRIGLREKGRLKQTNFEVSTDYEADVPESLDRIHALVDVAGSMAQTYFDTEGEEEFPFIWKQYPYKGKPIYLQVSAENTDLEAEANAFLGLAAGEILQEADPTDDALDYAEVDEHLHKEEEPLH